MSTTVKNQFSSRSSGSGTRTDKGKITRLPLRSSAMLLSRREVTVSGCRRIIEYSSAKIRLSVCEGEITVEGRGLTVHTYREDELTVRGWLTGIFFTDDPFCGECTKENAIEKN